MNHKTAKPGFIGLKEHTHAERKEIINRLVVPALRKELGKNLIAVAADGSYARDEDTGFSDIELMIFVRDKRNLPSGFGRISDGILVEGAFLTEQEYYKNTLEPNDEWFISGSDVLLPVTNPGFIKRIQRYRVKNLSEKCFAQSKQILFEIQESFGKLFTAIELENIENLFPVFADAVMQVLKLMAFINKTPYKTLGAFITQAKGFKIRPKGFDKFVKIVVEGKYTDLEILEIQARELFAGIEILFKKKMGNNIYDDNLSTIARKV